MVARYQDWEVCTIDQATELIHEMEGADPGATGKWFQWGIEPKESSELIGDIGFLNTDSAGKSWIGFTLDPRYWRQGLATEAVAAVMDHYRGMGIREVWASTDPQNSASRRLLERLRFVLLEETSTDTIYHRSLDG